MSFDLLPTLFALDCMLLVSSSRSVGYSERQQVLDGEKTAFECACKHALVVLHSDGSFKEDTPEASPVLFGEEGVVGVAGSLVDTGCLGVDDVALIRRLADEAKEQNSALAVQIGATGWYAVRDGDGWVHVESQVVEAEVGAKAPASRLRRSTPVNARFRCKVNML